MRDESATRGEIDRFVAARLDATNLTPSAAAPPRTLLRRVYFDLIGLPPTNVELDEFAADPTEARYEAAVDRLLASPRFGERWARHWLDIARYADTKGYLFEEDRNYATAYKYRDWVIESFNCDRPFDQLRRGAACGRSVERSELCAGVGFSDAGAALPQQPGRHHQRSDRCGHAGADGADGRLRSLSRSQVRSDQRGRLLFDVRRVRELEEKPREDAPPSLIGCGDAVRALRIFCVAMPAAAARGVRGVSSRSWRRRGSRSRSRMAAAGWNWRSDRQSRQSAHGAGVGESRLGTFVRPRAGDDAERFWRPRRSADSSGAARLARL